MSNMRGRITGFLQLLPVGFMLYLVIFVLHIGNRKNRVDDIGYE